VNVFLSFLNKLVGRTEASVDSIIADITKRIESLHIVAEAHSEAAKVHNEAKALSTRLETEAIAEFNRAKSIAAKFEALVS